MAPAQQRYNKLIRYYFTFPDVINTLLQSSVRLAQPLLAVHKRSDVRARRTAHGWRANQQACAAGAAREKRVAPDYAVWIPG